MTPRSGLHALRAAAEGSGDNKGLSVKLNEDEELIFDAIKDGQWSRSRLGATDGGRTPSATLRRHRE